MSHEIIKDGKTYYPVTSSQMNILQGEQVGPQYSNICMLFHLESQVDMNILEQAVNTALERMPTAGLRRHTFKDEKNPKKKEILQYFVNEPIQKATTMSFKSDEKMYKYLKKLSQKPFPKKSEDIPLYQVILINKADGKNALYCKMHHFINDAYGLMLFASDVLEIYKAMLNGTQLPEAPTPALPAFEDQWNYLGSKKESRDKEYWDNFWDSHELPQFATLNDYKNDKQRVPDQKYGNYFNIFHTKSDYIALPFKKSFVDKVNEYAISNGISPQILFMLAIRTYVYKVSGHAQHQVLQTMNAQRSKKNAKTTGGTLVVGNLFYFDVKNSESFADACKYTSNMQIEYYKHWGIRTHLCKEHLDANIPQNQIFSKGWVRGWSPNMFTYQPYQIAADSDIKFRMERIPSGITAMSLYLTIMYMDNYSDDLMGCYEYSTYNLTEETIRTFHNYTIEFLERAIANPEKTLDELM